MKNIGYLLTGVLFFLGLSTGYGQCEKWVGKPNAEEIKGAHSIYRGHLKAEKYDMAFKFWQQCFDAAPAADGKRDFHYTDGIKLYQHMYKNETDEAKKKEYAQKINELYDGVVECYRSGAIKLKGCEGGECLDQYIGFLRGRQTYAMYYELRTPYETNFETAKKAVELSGLKTEYVVVLPMANIMVSLFTNDRMPAETVREFHEKLTEICEYNIKNDKTYGAYYEQAQAGMEAAIARIETEVYDCDYFKNKLLPQYKMYPDSGQLIREVYSTLIRQGCSEEDPVLVEMHDRYEEYAAEVNARLQKELEEKNPSLAGKRLYDEGKYSEAADKYEEAAEKAEEDDKKAEYYFRLASIQGRQLNQYGNARSNALKAASLKEGYGRPYMLIGDLYASTSRNCGDSFNQRLAVLAAIDKYAYAKQIDPSLAGEANSKISRYNASKPSKEDAFMMGHKEGDKLKVGCWIGETVSLRF